LNFAAPWAAALAAAGLLIVIQYILRIRRPPLTVPSTFLWRRAAASARANTPWQRLRAEPLLFLQLLVIAALVVALMRPFVLRAGAANADLILILDSSVNSQFLSHGRQVINLERQQARSMVDNLPSDKNVSIIQLDGHPRIVLAGSTDHGAIQAALDGVRPDYEQPDFSAGLALAGGLQSGNDAASDSITLLRSVESVPPVRALKGLVDIGFGNAGAPNLGIASLATSAQQDGSIVTVMRIVNTGKSAMTSDIDVFADGTLQTVVHASIAGFGTSLQTALFAGPARIVEAHIVAPDDLAADNYAWSPVSTSSRKVLLVSPGNYFLSTALGLVSNTSVITATSSTYSVASAGEADLSIFDRSLPLSLPASNLMLIDPSRRVLGISVGPARAVGQVSLGDDPYGLLRYLSVSDIHIRSARQIVAPSWAHVALRDNNGPLLLEGEVPVGTNGGTQRLAVLAFSLGDSDLPLDLDFPILIANALDWMAPPTGVDATSIRPGAFARISVPFGTTAATIVRPDGSQADLLGSGSRSGGQVLFTDTKLPGAYQVRISRGASRHTTYFAVNTGAAHLDRGNAVIPDGGPKSGGPSQGSVPFDLTGSVALLVLAFLAAEWIVSMRKQ
jgi:Ca-activated chloride channel family protein